MTTVTQNLSRAKNSLTAAACNNDAVVVIGWDWQYGEKIPGCLGVAITRINSKGVREILQTHLPFLGTDNHDWKSQPSTVWPIQRKWWIDYTGVKAETYHYEIQAMGGSHDALKPIPGALATTNTVTLRTKVDGTFDVAFTGGELSTQWLSHLIGVDQDGNPDFQRVIDALADYKNPHNPIREHLVRNVPDLLMSGIKDCAGDGGHVYMALYELSSKQLVDFLLAHPQQFSLILGNTGPIDEVNAPARKLLHDSGADIHDRFIGAWGIAHNKSQVVVDKAGVPQSVITGSTNWTDTGLGCQSNIVARINNPRVAANFMDYWTRLLADNSQQTLEFRARNAKGYAPVKLDDGVTTIETWFQPSLPDKIKPADGTLSPFLHRAKELMEGAQDVLCGEVFYPGKPSVVQWMAEIWDNRPDLYAFLTVSTADALRGVKAKHRPGRPPLFTIASAREHAFADFIKELLKLPEGHAITHGKIIVIDPWGEKPVVIFGSDNLGLKASAGNDENALIVIGNKALAQYVFVNMFEINQHYASRAAADSHHSAPQGSGFTGKLAITDDWQASWSDGYVAKEAQLLVTGKWDGSGFKDEPGARSEFVVPFTPRS